MQISHAILKMVLVDGETMPQIVTNGHLIPAQQKVEYRYNFAWSDFKLNFNLK